MEREQIEARAVVRPIYPLAPRKLPAWPVALADPPHKPTVTVIVAALNEQDSLPHVLPRIPDVYEVILVDGNSTDATVATAVRLMPDIRIVTQPGKGKGDALRAGFEAARGDIVIAIDADGSTDPEEIPAFVTALANGADYVKGSRFAAGGGTSDMTLVRKAGNWGFVVLARLLFGARYTDFCYGFFGFWRSLLPVLDLKSDGFEIECEVNCRAAVTKLKTVEVPSFEKDRVAGEAHLRPFHDGWRVLMELIRQWRRGSGISSGRRAALRVLPTPSAEPRCMEGRFSD